MIVFPKLENYVSDYKNDNNVITIRIYEYPKKNSAKYFNIRTPFPYGAFVEMLQELVNQMRFDNLRIEQVARNSDAEEINIWQLAWYLNNIKDIRPVSVSINKSDGSKITYQIDVNNQTELNNLMRIIENSAY